MERNATTDLLPLHKLPRIIFQYQIKGRRRRIFIECNDSIRNSECCFGARWVYFIFRYNTFQSRLSGIFNLVPYTSISVLVIQETIHCMLEHILLLLNNLFFSPMTQGFGGTSLDHIEMAHSFAAWNAHVAVPSAPAPIFTGDIMQCCLPHHKVGCPMGFWSACYVYVDIIKSFSKKILAWLFRTSGCIKSNVYITETMKGLRPEMGSWSTQRQVCLFISRIHIDEVRCQCTVATWAIKSEMDR